MKLIRRNTNKRGFTLTEILLAVMIVGLIGIALAALTRSAARESGSGKTRIMLRNDYARFIRQLRQDLSKATQVILVNEQTGVLLVILQGHHRDLYLNNDGTTNQRTIGYCFEAGGQPAKPTGAWSGGIIRRIVRDTTAITSVKDSCSADGEVVLNNVKYKQEDDIEGNYPFPLFQRERNQANALRVRIITEVGTNPVVNEAFDQLITVPSGDIGY